jgi:hypothetical protein
MNEKIERIFDTYSRAEKDLIDELSKLKNWSNECECKDVELAHIIIEEETVGIATFCLNCGGYVNDIY